MQLLLGAREQHLLLDYWLETVLAEPWARPAQLALPGQGAEVLGLRPVAAVRELSLQVVQPVVAVVLP